MAPKNPFKPTAGANPPQLVGRAALIDEFVESIENGPGALSPLGFVGDARDGAVGDVPEHAVIVLKGGDP